MAKSDLQKVEEEHKDQKVSNDQNNGQQNGATSKGSHGPSHKSSKKSKGPHTAGK